jgi:SET domain-containing protein
MQIPECIKIIKTENKGNTIISSREIKKEEIIFKFVGKLLPQKEANKKALQIDEDLFLESTELFDDNLNHSCNPNCYIDFKNLNLIAKRDIKKGEELSFDYHTSEYDLIEQGCSFECHCGSKNCIGKIKGFRFLNEEKKKEVLEFASPYIKKKYQEELNS